MAKREIKYFLDFHGLDRYDDIVKNKIKKAIAEVVQFNVVVVESRPETGEEHTIYLVPVEDSSIGNIYEEYLWINNTWELIGSTQINLSDYYTKVEIDSSLNKINGNINDVSLRIDNVSSKIPTLTSQLVNDSSFVTEDELASLDLSTYAKDASLQEVSARIPTLTSQLVNDSSFVNEQQLIDVEYTTSKHIINLHKNVSILFDDISNISSNIPNKTSQLINDSSFVTEEEIASLDLSTYAKDASLQEVSARIPTLTSQLTNDSSFVSSEELSSVPDVSILVVVETPIIDKTSESATTFNIDPNKMYMFGSKTTLTINLNPGKSGIVNEYMFQFTSGNTATTLNVPNTITWIKNPDISTNKKYAVSIENNLGIIGEWSNE